MVGNWKVVDPGGRGGRKNGWFRDVNPIVQGKVLLSVDSWKESESGLEQGLEQVCREAALEESAELSQHKEL